MNRVVKKVGQLNSLTTEWKSLENEKERYYRSHLRNNDIGSTTIQTLYLMQERIDSLVVRIVKTVDWFYRNDEDFDNEVATYLYNENSSSIHRGLSNLIPFIYQK